MFEMFTITAEISDKTQLLLLIRGTKSDFKITEVRAAMRSVHSTTGKDLFIEVSDIMEDVSLIC